MNNKFYDPRHMTPLSDKIPPLIQTLPRKVIFFGKKCN